MVRTSAAYVPLARACAWLLLPAFCGLGCTDPSYGGDHDAGTDAAPQAAVDARPDANLVGKDGAVDTDAAELPGVEPDAGPRSGWWSALKRHYAIGIRFYGRDRSLGNYGKLAHEILMAGEVAVDADGTVQLTMQRCRDHGVLVTAANLRDEFHWVAPERLPLEHHALVLRPDGVRTDGPGRAIGYDLLPPASCSPGARIRVEGRKWLNGGDCECSSEPVPMTPNDCRVTDPDGDDRPGFTVQHQGLTSSIEGVRALDNCQIVGGALAADGSMRASYIENYDYRPIDCGAPPCPQSSIEVCPLIYNTVRFEPVAEALDCATLLQRVDDEALLPNDPLAFPDGC